MSENNNSLAITNGQGGLQTFAADKPFIDVSIREAFIKRLDETPTKIEKAQGFDSLPISFLEHELDQIYMGLWKTSNFRTYVIANEIVGTIDLEVFDPSVGIWLKRSGSAAVMIMQKSGAEATDISAKIKNTLGKDYSKLETMCLKKAAKTLGKRFGRDLNRKHEDEYEEIYTNEVLVQSLMPELTAEFATCNNRVDLTAVWKKYPDLHGNTAAEKLFKKTSLKFANG